MTKEELDSLNKMAILTGMLSEVHTYNLRAYPFVAFQSKIEGAEISYDIVTDSLMAEGGSKSWVSYRVFSKAKISTAEKRKALKTLEILVRSLLWGDVKVELYMNRSQKPVTEAKQKTSKKKTVQVGVSSGQQ